MSQHYWCCRCLKRFDTEPTDACSCGHTGFEFNFDRAMGFSLAAQERSQKQLPIEPKCGTICPPPKPPSILLEAEELIHGERRKEYGPVSKSFAQVAKLWSVVFGIEVTPKQVALAMGCLKLQRELHKHKRDNLRDYAGYMALAQEIEDEAADASPL